MRLFRKRHPIPAVQVLRPEPGDVIVLTVPPHLAQATLRSIVTDMERVLPGGVTVAVMADGMQIQSVLRAPSLAALTAV